MANSSVRTNCAYVQNKHDNGAIVTFDIKRSGKAYINSDEHYIVTVQGTIYLRIVGSEGNYTVMTATAGEDNYGISSFSNMAELNEAASLVSSSLGLKPDVKIDVHGREYIRLCRCEYLSDAYRTAELLFSHLESVTERLNNELEPTPT